MRKKLAELFGFGKVLPTIDKVTPKFPKNKIEVGLADLRKTIRETQGSTKKRNQDFEGAIRKVQSKIKQTSQKLKGEPVTESGFSKGRDLKKVEKKAKGGRIGYSKGTPKRETNVQKIKKTFGPKSLGMQSVIYGLDKNPKITKADPKAKFIAAANKKKKKVI